MARAKTQHSKVRVSLYQSYVTIIDYFWFLSWLIDDMKNWHLTVIDMDLVTITSPPMERPFGSPWISSINISNWKEITKKSFLNNTFDLAILLTVN